MQTRTLHRSAAVRTASSSICCTFCPGQTLLRTTPPETSKRMTLDAYLSVLEDCLRVLPRELVIHRMTGDGAKRSLIAPMWSADKKRVLNALNRRFLSDDLEQGSALLL